MKLRVFGVLLVFLFFVSIYPLCAQEGEAKKPEYGWKKGLVGNLGFTQTKFDNWVQGGEDTLAWQLNLNGKADQKEAKFNWANSGKVSYGRVKLGGMEDRKSVDEVKAESVFTYLLGVYVNPYVAATGETQFTAGYKYPDDPKKEKEEISNLLDPGYFSQSAGVGYQPVEAFKTRLGFAVRETITRNHPVPYADNPETKDKEEKIKVEPGIESVTDFSKTLIGGILLTSKLEMFSNFKGIDEINVKWDNIFAAKVSKYVDVTFNIKLLYDKNINEKRQIKQSLAVGLTYTFL